MLMDPSRVIPLAQDSPFSITPEHFYVGWHRVLCRFIFDSYETKKPIDLLCTSQALRAVNMLDACGGNAYLEKLIDSTSSSAHAEHYLQIVCDMALRRRLIESCRETVVEAQEHLEDGAEEILSRAQTRISSFIVHKKVESLTDIALSEIERWGSEEYHKSALRWPWHNMNQAIGHISDEYVVIAAQPSVGKSALALNIAYYHAKLGRRISFLSLESSAAKIAQRLIAIIGQVNTLNLRNRHATPEDFERAREAARKLKELDLRVTDEKMNLDQIRAWAHSEKHHGSGLLIIDNMKHVRTKRAYENRFDLFAEISLKLKEVRDDVKIPIIALHHLNADDKLAWSSDIQRDADMILIMAEDEKGTIHPTQANGWKGKCLVDVDCVKNREGTTGAVKLEFVKRYQTFIEANEKPSEPEKKPERKKFEPHLPYAE